MLRIRTIQWAFALVAAFSIGCLAYIAFMSRTAQVHEQIKINAERQASARLSTQVLWSYGVIESVDAATKSLIVRFSRFSVYEKPISVRVLLKDDTVIKHQDLSKEGQTYTGLLPSTQASFADLRPGMQIAGTIANVPEEKAFVARALFIGTPL